MSNVPMKDYEYYVLEDFDDYSCTYFMTLGEYVKIGMTKNLYQRISTGSTFLPPGAILVGVIPAKGWGPEGEELRAHRKFVNERIGVREWFHWTDEMLEYIGERGGMVVNLQVTETT